MKLVSIIVAIYNVEKYLKNCLDSIIYQSYKKIEIILVDDGSTDACGLICDEYALKDSRIKVIHKQNQGLGMARNSGLDVATGEYVLFVDSDDWLDKSMVQIMLDAATENSSDFVVCGFNQVNNSKDSEKKIKCTDQINLIQEPNIKEKVLYPILGARCEERNDIEREMCVWTNLYKMSLLKENNIRFVSEREYLSEDLFFNINYIMTCASAVLLPECLYNYRFNSSSLTNAYRPNRFVLLKRLYEKECDLLKKYGIYEEVKVRIQRTFIMKTRNAIRIIVNSKNEMFRVRFLKLEQIIHDECLAKTMAEYPIHTYRLSLRVPAIFMKKKLSFLLWIEQKIRYKIKWIGRKIK